MERNEKILGMGYLIKSPSKAKEKANLARFWKHRWCVFSKVTPLANSSGDSKLVFSYYESKEKYMDGYLAKGQLNISGCVSIKSHYQPQAGFPHIFSIECLDGKWVKFSALSCEVKYQWLILLCSHRYNMDMSHITEQSLVIGESRIQSPCIKGNSNHGAAILKSNSFAFERSAGEKMKREFTFRKGGGLAVQEGYLLNEKCSPYTPPLPPRNRSASYSQLANSAAKFSTGFAWGSNSCSGLTSPVNSTVVKTTYDHNTESELLCKICKHGRSRKRSSKIFASKRHRSLDSDGRIEVFEPGSPTDGNNRADSISSKSGSSGDSNDNEEIYVQIDRKFMRKLSHVSILPLPGLPPPFPDTDIYVQMNLFTNPSSANIPENADKRHEEKDDDKGQTLPEALHDEDANSPDDVPEATDADGSNCPTSGAMQFQGQVVFQLHL